MGMLRDIFNRRLPASLDSATFDTSGYDFQGGQEDGARLWWLPESGGVGLYLFPLTPDLPHVATIGQLKEFYKSRMAKNIRLVECSVVPLDGVQSIRLIIRELHEQRGATYVGSFTIPFRDFSFVIKIQCSEQGMTGLRETVIIAKALQNGTARWEEHGIPVLIGGWSCDDEQFDETIPDHPLPRVRRELRHIAPSIHIEPKIKDEARFELPPNDTD